MKKLFKARSKMRQSTKDSLWCIGLCLCIAICCINIKSTWRILVILVAILAFKIYFFIKNHNKELEMFKKVNENGEVTIMNRKERKAKEAMRLAEFEKTMKELDEELGD